MRFLTPTENKRLNELIGFLCIAVSALIAAALLSYSPHDASFNVSASSEEWSTRHLSLALRPTPPITGGKACERVIQSGA